MITESQFIEPEETQIVGGQGECCYEVDTLSIGKMKLTKIHELNFDQLKNRMQSVVHKLDSVKSLLELFTIFLVSLLQLVTRVTEKTELAMFLTQVCTNFR